MPPLHTTITLLAAIARIRGRHSEAAELSALARRLTHAADSADGGTDGRAARDALDAIRQLGAEAAVRSGLDSVPGDVRRVVEAGVAIEDLARIVEDTGAVTAPDLSDVASSKALEWLDEPRRRRLAAAAERVHTDRPVVALGRARSLLEALAASIRDACPEVAEATPVGRARRFDAMIRGLSVLVATHDAPRTASRLLALFPDADVAHSSPRAVVVRLERLDVVLRLVDPDAWGHALVWFTGSAAHVVRLGRLATELGWSLTRDGVYRGGRVVACPTEREVYAVLGLPYIVPELRERGDEVDAALAGALPDLVTVPDIRGELHMHSDWSDGRDSIESMVAAAVALGYEYVAITDHSVSSGIARGLDEDRLSRQRDAVARARESFPSISVLHGSEVDILPDGSLDFPDRVLETLDVVLASLHDDAGQDGVTLTRRYVSAMRHPLVQVVTHPTNRLVPGRPGYELDERLFFETAAATGTLVEIDGAPGHLDMDGEMARRAIAAGVEVTIDGDCHRAEWLGRQMAFGVATARRGWVEPRHVANTRPRAELLERLRRKHAFRGR